MAKFVETSVDALIVEISSSTKETFLWRKKRMLVVIVKKVSVPKNIANAMQMESNVAKHVTAKTVKTVELYIIYFLLKSLIFGK